MQRFLRRTWNRLVRGLYYIVYIFVAGIIYTSLAEYLTRNAIVPLATVSGSVIAVLFGFAAVLYNRGRALPPGPSQTRSLYAAERAMQASVLFMLATAVGGIGLMFRSWQVDLGNTNPPMFAKIVIVVCWFVAILIALVAFGCFYFALQAVASKLVRAQTIRTVVRRVRAKRAG